MAIYVRCLAFLVNESLIPSIVKGKWFTVKGTYTGSIQYAPICLKFVKLNSLDTLQFSRVQFLPNSFGALFSPMASTVCKKYKG